MGPNLHILKHLKPVRSNRLLRSTHICCMLCSNPFSDLFLHVQQQVVIPAPQPHKNICFVWRIIPVTPVSDVSAATNKVRVPAGTIKTIGGGDRRRKQGQSIDESLMWVSLWLKLFVMLFIITSFLSVRMSKMKVFTRSCRGFSACGESSTKAWRVCYVHIQVFLLLSAFTHVKPNFNIWGEYKGAVQKQTCLWPSFMFPVSLRVKSLFRKK